jgi:hypothetical protein
MTNCILKWIRKSKENKILGIAGLLLFVGFTLVGVSIFRGLDFKEVLCDLGFGIIAVAWSLEIILINVQSLTTPTSIEKNEIITRLTRIEEMINEKNVDANSKTTPKNDTFNEICVDLKQLSNKLEKSDDLNKELNDNPAKLNTSLLFLILKFYKDREQGDRDFAYTNLFISGCVMGFSIIAMVISIIAICLSEHLISVETAIIGIILYLLIAVVLLVPYGLFLKNAYKYKWEGKNTSFFKRG